MALEWPTSRQVNTAVGARVRSLLDHYDGAVGDLGRRVLTAKLALAIAPAARGHHRRDALVDAAGIDRDRGAEG